MAAERDVALLAAGARERRWVTNAYIAPEQNLVGLLTRTARR
jgi:hypothetical protein